MLIVNHAADETTVLPHRSIHGKTETLYPEAQTLVEIRAWNDRHTRLHVHRVLLCRTDRSVTWSSIRHRENVGSRRARHPEVWCRLTERAYARRADADDKQETAIVDAA